MIPAKLIPIDLEGAEKLREWLAQCEQLQDDQRTAILGYCNDLERVCTRLRGENRFEAHSIINALRALVENK